MIRILAASLLIAAGQPPVAPAPATQAPLPLSVQTLPPPLFPISSAAVRRAIAAGLEAEDRQAVSRQTLMLARMGGGLSVGTQARLAPLLDRAALDGVGPGEGPLAPALAPLFAANGAPITASRALGAVPERFRLVEGIAADPASGALYAGSVIDRSLLRLRGDAWERMPIQGLGGVFGLTVDGPRRLLWLASAGAEVMAAGDPPFEGIVAVDLDTGREQRRVAIPGARLGDMAVGPDGTVFASDGQSGAIHRCVPGCTTAEQVVAPGLLRSAQGMVVRPGRLIVADYAEGLVSVDLATGNLYRLLPPAPQMMEGIDGLLADGDTLIAIQNGTSPRRILRIRLTEDQWQIAGIEVLERAHPDWGEPTLGTIRGGELIYVADAQWERYGPGGARRDAEPVRATAIRALPLRR